MKNSQQPRRFRVVLILAMLLCMLCSLEAFAKPDPYRVLAKEGATAYDRGEFDLALAKFQEAYAINANSDLLYNMGRVCESKADYTQAVVYYKQFVTAPGSNEDARVDAIERIKAINEVLAILNTPAGGYPAAAPAAAPVAAPVAVAAAPVAAAPSGPCIDINTGSQKDLEKLNGVGPATATKIIGGRPYSSVDSLTNVKGIGPKTLDKMRAQICPIGGGAPAPAPVAAPVKAAPAKPAPAKPAPAKPAALKPNTANDIPILDI